LNKVDQILKDHGLRVTNMRKNILEIFSEKRIALSNNDIEKELEFPDRITVYRTLKKFEESGILHRVYDTSDNAKYALCINGCDEENHLDGHVHFECNACGNTICLDDTPFPMIKAPSGYIGSKTEILISGICKSCNVMN